ncbi:MAG: DM13 domain-containing protein, partial [Chloroflexi bacterium]|nr:DM13 domain-containing protein [Chloroflexota bacterium]
DVYKRQEPTPSPTPEVDQAEAGGEEVAGIPTPALEPTVNPIFIELLAEVGEPNMVIGDDPFVIQRGDFVVIDSLHRGEGRASIYDLPTGDYVLRLDPFSVTAGPNLHVILSEHPEPRTAADTLLANSIDLGVLEDFAGTQNYVIPPDTNVDRYNSVVIFSLSENIVFTAASLIETRGQ